MQGGGGRSPRVYRMLKGDLSEAAHHEPGVSPDLNGINMEYLIHLNRFIFFFFFFLVDETKLEDMNRAYLSYGVRVCVLMTEILILFLTTSKAPFRVKTWFQGWS